CARASAGVAEDRGAPDVQVEAEAELARDAGGVWRSGGPPQRAQDARRRMTGGSASSASGWSPRVLLRPLPFDAEDVSRTASARRRVHDRWRRAAMGGIFSGSGNGGHRETR